MEGMLLPICVGGLVVAHAKPWFMAARMSVVETV